MTRKQNGPLIRMQCLVTLQLSIAFALTLILGGCAIQKTGNAGRVNGVYIPEEYYLNSLMRNFTAFKLEKDRAPDEREMRELVKKTWRDITIRVILNGYYKKYDIKTTRQEVMDSLLQNIPPSMKTAPAFQTDGRFDRQLYVEALTSETSQQLDWLKQKYFNDYIPLAKLKRQLMVRETLSNRELAELRKLMNTKADIEWIVFDSASETVTVTQTEVEDHYRSHIDDYRVDKAVELGWVNLPVKADLEDEQRAREVIDSLYFEATNGKPFTWLAELHSQAHSAAKSGNLGFLQLEKLPVSLQAALAGLESGRVTRPIKLNDFWYIYQVAERTPSLVKLNEIGIAIISGPNNISAVRERAVELRTLAGQIGLPTAASELDYPYSLSGPVNKYSAWLDDPDTCAYLTDRAFEQKAGALLDPVYSKTMQAWILAEVIRVQPHDYRPLLEASAEIVSLLSAQKQRDSVLSRALAWVSDHYKDPLKAAAGQNMQVVYTAGIGIDGSVLDESVAHLYVDAVRRFTQKQPPTAYAAGYFVLVPVVKKIEELEPKLYSETEARQYYSTRLHPDWFDSWLEDKIQKADVKIWLNKP